MHRITKYKGKVVSAARKTGAAVFGSLVSLSAFAQTATDQPADLDSAAAFMQTKGAIALAVAAVITLITLGIKGAKLPRRG